MQCSSAILDASGHFQITAHHSWTVLTRPFAEMVLVAFFEEILFHGVLFRITERSLGSWPALLVSSLLFALAHLPNAGITVLAVVDTAVAGVLLAAAYMASRAEGTPGSASRNCISPERETPIYEWYWCKGHNISWGPSERTPICADGD